MDLLGVFSEGFVITVGVFCVFAMVGFIVTGLIETTLVLFLALAIPTALMVFEYWRNKEKREDLTAGKNNVT